MRQLNIAFGSVFLQNLLVQLTLLTLLALLTLLRLLLLLASKMDPDECSLQTLLVVLLLVLLALLTLLTLLAIWPWLEQHALALATWPALPCLVAVNSTTLHHPAISFQISM
jgi:hypothetical protein